MDEILRDERFKHIAKDARFKTMHKKERTFKVDRRFKNMFHDKNFKLKYSVDKRGRPVNLTTNENLKKYYDISSSEDDSEEENDEKKKPAKKENEEELNVDETEEEETDRSEEKNESEKSEESEGSSSSEDSDDSDNESVESLKPGEIDEIPWNDLDQEAQRADDVSPRLALCNMDWDRIKSLDIFMLFNSFKPPQGVLKSVKVYLSDYGRERLEYERLHGPKELTESTSPSQKQKSNDEIEEYSDDEDDRNGQLYEDKDDDDEEEGTKFDRHKLRLYQFNRLRYYYAIIECDSSETANKIYTECDGMEYESSSTRVDLRFVPDGTEFDEFMVRDQCLEAPDPVTYKPNLFVNTALNQTKVECTWDETPHDRLALTMRHYTEDDIKNTDFKHILATSSEEEEDNEENNNIKNKNNAENNIDELELKKKKRAEKFKRANKEEANEKYGEDGDENDEEEEEQNGADEEENRLSKYRKLLLGADNARSKKSREAGLEFSWDGGMEEEGFSELLFNSNPNKKQNAKKKDYKKKVLTDEEIKEQAELSLLTMDAEEDTKAHFNLDDLLLDSSKTKKKKRQGNKKDVDESAVKREDDFEVNLKDPRFAAIFTDHKFNIDPSDQSFKKTKAMENILNEKIKRIQNSETAQFEQQKEVHEESNNASSMHTHNNRASDPSVSLMIKSIKSKTEILKRKKEEINNIKKKIRLNR